MLNKTENLIRMRRLPEIISFYLIIHFMPKRGIIPMSDLPKNDKNTFHLPITSNIDWKSKSGKLPARMTNDYLFKALAQSDPLALKSLISAVLHLEQTSIQTVDILNPIILGRTIDNKDFILDLNISMNQNTVLNLEMQVINYGDWPERSLQYLCRAFDGLHSGEDYDQSRTAVHAGILDFNLFPKQNALHESYRMMEVKTHRIYTGRFQLYVLCLPQIKKASEEDRKFKTDVWAKFFRAKTWEDLKMLAAEHAEIDSAAATMAKLCEDLAIREQIQAREDFFRRERTQIKKIKSLEANLGAAYSLAAREKERADSEKERADKAELKIAELKELLKKYER